MIGEWTSPRTVVALLTVDAALLAMMELFFLTLAVGSVPVPISPVVALLTTPWLVRRAGELGGPRAAAAPLLAWVLVIAVLGLVRPGGDVLLVGDWPALALVVCGLVPAAFVLGRVLRRARDAGAGPPEPPPSPAATAPRPDPASPAPAGRSGPASPARAGRSGPASPARAGRSGPASPAPAGPSDPASPAGSAAQPDAVLTGSTDDARAEDRAGRETEPEASRRHG